MSIGQYNPDIHHRRSIRLKGHDYAGGSLYFVTICAHQEFIQFAKGNPFGATCVSGKEKERATCVSPVRGIIAEEWARCGEIRDDVFPCEFVVMADHFHGLIRIEKSQSELGHVIGAFKAAVSRRIRRRGDTHVALSPHDAPSPKIKIWHRNYYE
ncbi:MAG: transposase, partial [Kiritimatiellae bacterium]|nr:transposase [Kiritimatiellia bacterium]